MDNISEKVWKCEEIQREIMMRPIQRSKVNDLPKLAEERIPKLVEERIFQTWWAVFYDIRKKQ